MAALDGSDGRRIAERYAGACAHPTFVSASLQSDPHAHGAHASSPVAVIVHASQHDPTSGTKKEWAQTVVLREAVGAAAEPAVLPLPLLPTPLPTGDIVSASPEGDRLLVITNPKDTGKAASIELWESPLGFARTLVSAEDTAAPHGKVHAPDSTFGCVEWSPDGGRVLFCAEVRVTVTPATAPFRSAAGGGGGGDAASTAGAVSVHEFAWRESWGEQHTDVIAPRLFVLDLTTGSVSPAVAPGRLEGWSLGKGCWAPLPAYDCEGEIAFTAWPPQHRLGIIYCTNRPSQVFTAVVGDDGSYPVHIAGTADVSAKLPSFCPSGDVLLHLQCHVGGPHCRSAQLVARPWPLSVSAKPVVVIDHGALYGVELSTHKTWLGPKQVILQTQSESASRLVLASVDVDAHRRGDAGAVAWRFADDIAAEFAKAVGSSGLKGSAVLLAARGGRAVVSFSTPNTPPVLFLCSAPATLVAKLGGAKAVALTPVKHAGVSFRTFDLKGGAEAILCEPDEALAAKHAAPANRPLVVWPHGGPHSMTECAYTPYAAAFVACGYTVVAPNYTGSAGFGDDKILELASGKCGVLDVADVNSAASAVIAAGRCSANKVYAFGGSHGGFLTAHLTAQFPERYKAAVLRNPVVDIASMVGCTDIPDWCWTECGLVYPGAGTPPSGAVLAKMHEASPLHRVDAVRAPSLLLIGLQDARVPVPQGFLWHQALRARGVESQVRTYPDDCHPLSSVKCAADAFVQSVRWFDRHK